jgi:hypothetical protein
VNRSLLAVLALVIAGCATSHTAAVRKNVAPAGYSIKKLVVVGFSKDAPTRQTFEDAFSKRMSTLGTDAETSYGIMPDLEDLQEDGALEVAKAKTGADTSVLVEVVESNESARVATGVAFGAWVAGLLTGDSDLRRVAWAGSVGTRIAEGDWKLRITLWNMADNSLLWSVDTDSYMQGSTEVEAANLATFIHGELKTDGLVP